MRIHYMPTHYDAFALLWNVKIECTQALERRSDKHSGNDKVQVLVCSSAQRFQFMIGCLKQLLFYLVKGRQMDIYLHVWTLAPTRLPLWAWHIEKTLSSGLI